MEKKYKLYRTNTKDLNSNYNDFNNVNDSNDLKQKGGFSFIPSAFPSVFPSNIPPVIPLINPFTPQVQVLSPALPTIQPTFNTFAKPLLPGPKINIFPYSQNILQKTILPDASCPQKPLCPPKIIIPTPCQQFPALKKCDVLNLFSQINRPISPFSPLSADLPITFNFSQFSPHSPVSLNQTLMGAGILIIEKDYQGKGPTLLLFRSNGQYQECGGSVDKKDVQNYDYLQMAAKRELREESKNLLKADEINLSSTKLFVDTPFEQKSYRIYVLSIYSNIIDTNDYNNNSALLNKDNVPPEWKETDDIQRFYLSDFKNYINNNINNNNVTINDVNGMNKNIRPRTIRCIRKLLQVGTIDNSLMNLKYVNKFINKTSDFLNGTITYNLS